jgi:ABC-type multidrug transport system fused ATPase/permease subunit
VTAAADLSRIFALVGAATKRWVAALVGLKLASRVALVVAALFATSATPAFVVGVTVTFGALFALQGLVRAVVLRDARRAIATGAGAALLRADVLSAAATDDHDTEFTVYDGLNVGERLVVSAIPDLVADSIASAIAFALVAAAIPARVVLLGFAAIVVGAAFVALARRIATRADLSTDAAHLAFVDALAAAIRGRLDVVASGREPELLARLERAVAAWTSATMRADRVSSLAGRAPMLGAAVAAGLVVAIDQMAAGGALTLEAIARGAILASAVPPFAGLARSAIEIARARAQLGPFVALLAAPERVRGGGAPVPALPASLRFDDVRFTYTRASRAALAGVTFEHSAPGLLAFAGPNGSGKSTCLRLLLGLAPPDAGAIAIGGASILTLDLVAWRRRTSFLPQRPYLPERATVRDAVKLLAVDADDGAIEAALAKVEVIDALRAANPDAPLEVVVGTLSTGQRQRVAIARALAQDADVLVFDEPDANLDAAGVARVVRLLKDAAKQRVVVVAAHTEELVAAADRVVRLESGVVDLRSADRVDGSREAAQRAPSG